MTTLPQNARPVTALLGTKLGMTQVWDEAGPSSPSRSSGSAPTS